MRGNGLRLLIGLSCLRGCEVFLRSAGCETFVNVRLGEARKGSMLKAFFQGDGFRPDETVPFTQSGSGETKQTRRKGGVDEIDEDSDVFNTGVFNPYEILDLSPLEDIGEEELRAAFRKQAKRYHPDVPRTGDAEKFQLIKKAVEELASLGMIGEWRGKIPNGRSQRKERGQTVSEDYWELRGRDFFAELETELTDELKMRFNESDKDLTLEQLQGRKKKEDEYWQELQIRQADQKVLDRVGDWMEKKREERRLILRQRLRGVVKPEPDREERASKEIMRTVERRISQWLGLPKAMFSVDMTLEEIGFLDGSSWDDVAVCLMLLEEETGKSFVNMVEKKDLPTTLQLPKWVKTVEDLADFVQNSP